MTKPPAHHIPRSLGGTSELRPSDLDDAISALQPLLKRERELARNTMIGTPVHFAVSILGELRNSMTKDWTGGHHG